MKTPIANATVSAASAIAKTDQSGQCVLGNVPAGLVLATAMAAGHAAIAATVDLVAGQTAAVQFALKTRANGLDELSRAIDTTGNASVYGLQFDFNSAALRPGSESALESVLALVKSRTDSRWTITGHTDNRGTAAINQRLSQARAAAVITWLSAHGVSKDQLVGRGVGSSIPLADNSTDAGRELNRRVEVAPLR